ncbi:MAG TPA: aminotransferase class I/II-fold pyridoxal phosphate-dependent enzyme [Pyrinomonadaceae bacterium]|nr:aminotransferase class I/II-fold pyridoxal phosphate-dependent enzyme [Pyrinomonadaceae bacterium]
MSKTAQPLVSCVMPTANRLRFVPQAIRYFQAQDYPHRELLILDDGPEAVQHLVPADDARIRYMRLDGGRTLGEKRNESVRQAAGDLIMHWDDDDWMAPHRISYQVGALLAANADACGLDRMFFYELATGKMWLYQYPPQRRAWLAGGSLLYTRDFWRRSPFPDIQVASDTRFILNQQLDRAVFLPRHDFYVALIHEGNTSPKNCLGSFWSLCDAATTLASITGDDDARFYHSLTGRAPETPDDAPHNDDAAREITLSTETRDTLAGNYAVNDANDDADNDAVNEAGSEVENSAGAGRGLKLRIGYVLANFPALSETFILREVLALCRAGHQVFVYTNQRHRDELVPEPDAPNLTIRSIQYRRNPDALAQAIEFDAVQHLHASLMLSAQHAAHEAARRLRIPFTLTAYSGLDLFTAQDPHLYRDISADPLCTGIIVEDEFMRAWITERLGAQAEKVLIIPNSFDVELYRLSEPRGERERVVILSIARFVEKKGLIYLVEAFRRLSERRAGVELWLVGRGPEEAQLRRAAGANPHIKFLGARPEAETRKLYAAADIFCLPCIRTAQDDADGVPTTVLEAMAYELPVVTSNLLSMPHYVRDGEEGILNAPADTAAITVALERLSADAQLRARLGRAGRKRVEQMCDLRRNIELLQRVMRRGKTAEATGSGEAQVSAKRGTEATGTREAQAVAARSRASQEEDMTMQVRQAKSASRPLVSIGITTYNRAQFLRTCIDSVLNQTYQPVEVVVVDDGSTDATRAVLESYGRRIRAVYNGSNCGIAHAKNRALQATSADAAYIGILDSDDFFHPRFVERAVAFLENRAGVGLVYTDDVLVDAAGREMMRRRAVEPWSVEAWLDTRNLRGDTWLARRELVMQTALHDESLSFDVDYDLFYQLLELTAFAHLPEHLVYIRQHPGQTTHNHLDLAKCHAANLVKYGYSPDYAYRRAGGNQHWFPAIEQGIALGQKLYELRTRERNDDDTRVRNDNDARVRNDNGVREGNGNGAGERVDNGARVRAPVEDKLAIEGGVPVREKFLLFGAPCLGEEEIAEVVETLRSGWIGTGPKAERFEREFADYVGARHAVSLNSCTAGLFLSLKALGVGAGDEVITTPLTFAATVNAIEHTGARPVLVDINPATLNLDVALVARAVTARTRAVIPVHFGGLSCEMDALRALAREHKIAIVEDAAHATGTRYRGRMAGTLGTLASFSFYANKNLTTAEGGMVTTDDERLAAQIKSLRLHGLSGDAWKRFGTKRLLKSDIIEPGYKFNMPDIAAAIGLQQLRKQERFIRTRQCFAAMYDEAFAGLPVRLQTRPRDTEQNRHSLHLYAVVLERGGWRVHRDEVIEALLAENIGAALHYRAVHTHPFYRDKYGYQPADYPHAFQTGESILSLPLTPGMTDADALDVIHAFQKVARAYAS